MVTTSQPQTAKDKDQQEGQGQGQTDDEPLTSTTQQPYFESSPYSSPSSSVSTTTTLERELLQRTASMSSIDEKDKYIRYVFIPLTIAMSW